MGELKRLKIESIKFLSSLVVRFSVLARPELHLKLFVAGYECRHGKLDDLPFFCNLLPVLEYLEQPSKRFDNDLLRIHDESSV